MIDPCNDFAFRTIEMAKLKGGTYIGVHFYLLVFNKHTINIIFFCLSFFISISHPLGAVLAELKRNMRSKIDIDKKYTNELNLYSSVSERVYVLAFVYVCSLLGKVCVSTMRLARHVCGEHEPTLGLWRAHQPTAVHVSRDLRAEARLIRSERFLRASAAQEQHRRSAHILHALVNQWYASVQIDLFLTLFIY